MIDNNTRRKQRRLGYIPGCPERERERERVRKDDERQFVKQMK